MSTESTHPDRADHPGAGFVPRLGADPSSARYELLTAAQAVERVAAVGFDRADAELMVDQYLAQNTAAVGAPSGDGWRIDPYDLAEIARAYDWVDHYQGETIADARARAAQYAADYQRRADTMDRDQDPARAEQLDRETVVWGDRAREGDNPWPVPDPRLATADGTVGELTAAEERAAVEAVSNALLDEADPASGSRSGDSQGHDGAGVGDTPAGVAWWAPVDPEHTLTRDDVVAELTHRGMTADQAAAAVTQYLDDTSREIGVPVHRWGMDSHDIEAITHTHAAVLTGRAVSDPWMNAAGPDLTAATQVGPDREDGGPARGGRGLDLSTHRDAAERLTEHAGLDRSDLDAIAAEQRVAAVRDAVTQASTAPARSSRQDGGAAEQERRAQLAVWAHADTTDDHSDSAGHEMEQQR